MPVRILDLYAEFRCLTSGLPVPCGNGLLGALAYYGLDGLEAIEKDAMRDLAIRGGPYTREEVFALLDYCQSDVDALMRLLPVMLPKIDLPRALLRGRYMAAAARIERNGVPIDVEMLERLRKEWLAIKGRLISAVDVHFGVFVPTGARTLNPTTRFGQAVWLEAGEWNIDPYQLADAVCMLWKVERETTQDLHDARRAARKATRLTRARMDAWEDSGFDYATYPNLDTKARELAGMYPALEIGPGYSSESGYENIDYGERLWTVLRERDETVRPRHDADLIRQAAEMVYRAGPMDYRPMTFSSQRWACYLTRENIPWPHLPTGGLALDDDTFREMSRAYPEKVGPIRELRHALSQLRLQELTVGADGRNRYMLSAFASRTGRNQPSNTESIFGPSVWLRGLIRPMTGRAIAYVDWSQQELGIAAALSGDLAMQEAYVSGDFYLTFAKMANAVPPDATKQTHAGERDQFKTVALGVLYGLGEEGLARKLGVPVCRGRELLQLHRQTFRGFWNWSDRVETEGMLTGRLHTVFGWTVQVGPNVNSRSLRNFPMQANGAEMLRLACCMATEEGIEVCAPVHDALLVGGSDLDIENVVLRTQEIMRRASEIVLRHFCLRTEAKTICHPERYVDPRGGAMWETICAILDALESGPTPTNGSRGMDMGGPNQEW